MVSIFAESVSDETQTVNFADNDLLIDEIPAQLNLPTTDISATVGGFTYIESAVMEFNFVGGMDIQIAGGTRFFFLDAKPSAEFDGSLDVFSGVQEDTIVEIRETELGEFSTVENFSGNVAIDSYVDTPLVIGYDFTVDGTTSTFAPRADGAQTIDMNAKISLIGRQP